MYGLLLATTLSTGLLGSDAAAAALPLESVDTEGKQTLWTGDRYRYGEAGVFERALLDLVAIPASAPTWTTRGWLELGGVSVVTVGLMLPLDPSLDVRLDQYVYSDMSWLPHIWGMEMQVPLWTGLAVGSTGLWGAAWLLDWPREAQAMSLAAEALAVNQVYHLGMKLPLGREGPENGDGLGLVLGPTESFRLFPAGTPSGHAATLFSFLAVLDAYYRPPLALSVPLHVGLSGLIAMHALNHKHFISDSFWGAAQGYAIGRWVVKHRASRDHLERTASLRPPVDLDFGPWQPQGGGAGVMMELSW